jgi:hypothetical protein
MPSLADMKKKTAAQKVDDFTKKKMPLYKHWVR